MASSNHLAVFAERLVYRIAGLPIALSALWLTANGGDSADTLPMDAVFASYFWSFDGLADGSELLMGIVAAPLGLLIASLWFTARNGQVIKRRSGKRLTSQWLDQVRLYFSAGVLPPWYYIFSLYDESRSERARSFVQRFETKPLYFRLLKHPKGSPLNDKVRFARYCGAHGVPCVETIAEIDGASTLATLPDHDLFIKPSTGRGGRGAERWDWIAPFVFSGPGGERRSAAELIEHLVYRARSDRIIVQPRLRTHPDLLDLTAGALPTVRVVTCLGEGGEPELIGAVFRMSIGSNKTVDNFHAGGIAAGVDLKTGSLSQATDLGADARLGWLSRHPNTDALIEGRRLPLWNEVKQLAITAHRAFSDRVVIGWDIAVTEDDSVVVVEGNGNPDMDIIQRFMRVGLRGHRFGELLNFHIRQRLASIASPLPARPFAP